jgi:D-amino-acid oxidase
MQSLANQRRELGLESFSSANSESHQIPWPNPGHGGLCSHNDGRIDPLALQRALRRSLKTEEVALLPARVTALHRQNPDEGNRWGLELDTGHNTHYDVVVICTALASALLLQPLGHEFPMDAVLGQVLDLQVSGHHRGLGSLASSAGLQWSESDSPWTQQALAWSNPGTRRRTIH